MELVLLAPLVLWVIILILLIVLEVRQKPFGGKQYDE